MSCRLFESELDAYFDGELNAESSRSFANTSRSARVAGGGWPSVQPWPASSGPPRFTPRQITCGHKCWHRHTDGSRFVAPLRADFVGRRRNDGHRTVPIGSRVGIFSIV
jgi:hypothetical protein